MHENFCLDSLKRNIKNSTKRNYEYMWKLTKVINSTKINYSQFLLLKIIFTLCITILYKLIFEYLLKASSHLKDTSRRY